MKIVFFGTPEFVLPICDALYKSFNRAREKDFFAVVTQTPKRSGRQQNLTYSAVDSWAFKHKLQIVRNIEEVPYADLAVVAAYGQIIPTEIISKFTHGMINVHPSLLPEFRGASPIQATLALGRKKTGVTVIKMDEKMDHGPIISCLKEDVMTDDTNLTLRSRLFEKSAEFLTQMLPNYLNGKIKPKEQDHTMASFTKLVKKEDGYINGKIISNLIEGVKVDEKIRVGFFPDEAIDANPENILNLYRAFDPWPGIFTRVDTDSVRPENNIKVLILKKIHVDADKLVLDEVQLEGKNVVSFDQFKAGYPNYKF